MCAYVCVAVYVRAHACLCVKNTFLYSLRMFAMIYGMLDLMRLTGR